MSFICFRQKLWQKLILFQLRLLCTTLHLVWRHEMQLSIKPFFNACTETLPDSHSSSAVVPKCPTPGIAALRKLSFNRCAYVLGLIHPIPSTSSFGYPMQFIRQLPFILVWEAITAWKINWKLDKNMCSWGMGWGGVERKKELPSLCILLLNDLHCVCMSLPSSLSLLL